MNSQAEQETVRSVVLAYAAGKIELEKPSLRNGKGLRAAPGFRIVPAKQIEDVNLLYNAESVARFLGGH